MPIQSHSRRLGRLRAMRKLGQSISVSGWPTTQTPMAPLLRLLQGVDITSDLIQVRKVMSRY